jgi:hypothetical protein
MPQVARVERLPMISSPYACRSKRSMRSFLTARRCRDQLVLEHTQPTRMKRARQVELHGIRGVPYGSEPCRPQCAIPPRSGARRQRTQYFGAAVSRGGRRRFDRQLRNRPLNA